jgi:serine/threonine-protein kinase
LLVLRREYDKALALLKSIPDTPDNFPYLSGSKAMQLADLYSETGDTARARPLYQQALEQARAELAAQAGSVTKSGVVWSNIADAQLGLGHTDEALQAIARSTKLMETDQVYGPTTQWFNAGLYAQAKRADLAVPLIERVLTAPGSGAFASAALLRISPAFDPIRYDPGFRALLKRHPVSALAGSLAHADALAPAASTGAPP